MNCSACYGVAYALWLSLRASPPHYAALWLHVLPSWIELQGGALRAALTLIYDML